MEQQQNIPRRCLTGKGSQKCFLPFSAWIYLGNMRVSLGIARISLGNTQERSWGSSAMIRSPPKTDLSGGEGDKEGAAISPNLQPSLEL